MSSVPSDGEEIPDAVDESVLAGINLPQMAGIRRLTALDTVRARIAMAVDLGLLKPGDKLPPNASIGTALDVGEITVRRALESLCDDGVLVRLRGRSGGTLVADNPRHGTVAETEAYRQATNEVHSLIDQRLLLECAVAHLAARHATTTQIARLDRLVAQMAHATTWSTFHQVDQRFHLAVATATGISTAADHYRPVLLELYRYYLPYPVEYLRESNAEHAGLVAALSNRDTVTAVDIARRHVEVLHKTMFVGLDQKHSPNASRRERRLRPGR